MTEKERPVGYRTRYEVVETGVRLSDHWTILTDFSSRYMGVMVNAENPNVL
jgi:hypothetical protein